MVLSAGFRRAARLAVPLVLLVAVVQGLLYMLLLPPWQHYDEPSHFEYAWLLAHSGSWFEPVKADQELRREVAASMQEHGFYRNLPPPDLLNDQVRIGYSALGHPPGYYALVSLPLRLANQLDVTTQLYVARSVSVVLFVLTIAIAAGIMCDLTPPGHSLRWAVPLALALLPPFADVMTAVNNDVGAVLAASFLLWGAVQVICHSITWWRVAWLILAGGLTLLTKSTAAVLLALLPLVFVIALWVRQSWQWRWLVAGAVGATLVLVLAATGWGDAAYWYRWLGTETQDATTRRADPAAPIGTHVILLEVIPDTRTRHLVAPVPGDAVWGLAAQRITFGGWLWASRTVRIPAPRIMPDPALGSSNRASPARQIDVTTTPTFVAWSFDVPADIRALHYVFSGDAAASKGQPLQLFLDGAVLAQGAFPTDTSPVFDDATAQSGTWGGKPFVNLVRNGSAEVSWPRTRPWVERSLGRLVSFGWGRTPSQLLAVLVDGERTSGILRDYVGFTPLDSLFIGLAWGHIRLADAAWFYVLRGAVGVALLGCAWWCIQQVKSGEARLRAVVVVFGLAMLVVWGNTGLRTLPKLSEGFVVPVARYAFPVIIPTVLALLGGWWMLWPRRMRTLAVVVLISALAALNIASVATVWSFYQ